MSGTSLDGVDGVLTSFNGSPHAAYVPFPDDLRHELLALQAASENEIHREALAANRMAYLYAECVQLLLNSSDMTATDIAAIGSHGQTIRHLPDQGYTRQINSPALLAELTGIDVIADFRSRDIAAGGQGAPLVPAFHQAIFGDASATRVVANIGGISNISILHPQGEVLGYDTGPGNLLMDYWAQKHLGQSFDLNGNWAASGKVLPELMNSLMSESYLSLPAPKSTGRDLFNPGWLEHHLQAFVSQAAVDVQATLTAYTAHTLADAIRLHAAGAESVYVCGGGALNGHLMSILQAALPMPVKSTDSLGVAVNHVEAMAFAWLAARFCQRLPGNLASVTGARGPRILGALYPA